jgi:uncharacterized protein (DUF697 family)
MPLEITISPNAAAANQIVSNNVALAMGAGLIPLPWLDFAAITAVQLKMGKELAEFYGIDYKEEQVKGIVVALIASYTSTSVAAVAASSVSKSLPGLGAVFGAVTLPVIAGGLTYAVGKIFVQHIESGGTFLSFKVADVQAGFLREVEKGKEVVSAKAKGLGVKMAEVSDKLEDRLDSMITSLTKR